jgi:hypothetical protein
MKLTEVIVSDVSTEAKVAAIAVLLDKELPKLVEQVTIVQKLEGPQGPQGVQGPQGDKGDQGERGEQGLPGRDGSNGIDGRDGKDGISVVEAKIDFDDSLVFTLSDGSLINVGEVKGEKGDKGEQGPRGAAGMSGVGGGNGGFYNIDGGLYNSVYGGTTALDAGGP